MGESEIVIDWLGGNCPVQAEGTVRAVPFYFRARGARWSVSIGGDDIVCAPDWHHEEAYGDGYEAGWMDKDEAEAFLRAALARYLRGEPGETLPR